MNDQLLAELQILRTPDFENEIPYMYVDTKAKITVGVGHNITDNGGRAALVTLQFWQARQMRKSPKHSGGGTPIPNEAFREGNIATFEQKRNDYDFLLANTGLRRYPPENLEEYTTVEMDNRTISSLFETDLQRSLEAATAAFDKFTLFPISCQAALIDIAFNAGPNTFKSSTHGGFHTIVAALRGDGPYGAMSWNEQIRVAMENCSSNTPNRTRNTKRRQWLEASMHR